MSEVYVGAFVVCKPSNQQYAIQYFGCVDCNKRLPKYLIEEVKFCSTCGKPIAALEPEMKERTIQSTSEACDKMGERLFSPEMYADKNNPNHFYIPNIQTKAKLSSFDEQSWVDISEETIYICSGSFLVDFAKEIEFLQSYYGKNNVEVRFGALTYYT